VRRVPRLSLLAGILIALLGTASAEAATTYRPAAEFGYGDLAKVAGIAVDNTSGNVLAVDSGSNRVNVYDPAGPAATLLTTFGAAQLAAPEDIAVDQSNGNVYVTSPDADEAQILWMTNASGGTFTLGFEGQNTAPIAYGASPAEVQAALEALSTIGVGSVLVEGVPDYRAFTFRGDLAEADLKQLIVDGSALRVATPEAGPAQAVVETTRNGVAGKVVRFVPDNRANPTSYAADPSFDSPSPGPKAALGQIGSFASPIAVDPANGDLLIGDNGNRRVVRFSSSGEFLGNFTGASSPNGPISSFFDLTVTPGGQIYLIRGGDAKFDVQDNIVVEAKVERFVADGSGGTPIEGPELDHARSLAFDPALGNLIVAVGGWFTPTNRPELEVYHDGALVERVQYPSQLSSAVPPGLALDSGQSGRLYAAVQWVFGADIPSIQVFSPLSIPTVTGPFEQHLIGSGDVTVRFSGSVDPLGRPTKYHFEYAIPGASWTATPEMHAGSGEATVPVTAEVTLAVETSYQVRLVTSGYGASVISSPLTFSTPMVPTAVTDRADHLGPTSATLHGLLDSRGVASSYRFEYGTGTEYGSASPLISSPAPAEGQTLVALAQAIGGLKPATTYHYRLVVEGVGGIATGADATFTTPAVTSPRPVAPTISAPRSITQSPKAKRCRKGRHLRTLHGKRRCVKPHKRRSRRR
jgi:hypothetical protein